MASLAPVASMNKNWRLSFELGINDRRSRRNNFQAGGGSCRRCSMNNILETLPEIQAFMESMQGNKEDISVVLVGSVARHTQGENSDIDLLVISRCPVHEGLSFPSRVHLMRSTFDEFSGTT